MPLNLDTSASDVAMGQLSALPFGHIFGAPLKAAIEAQAMAAMTTVDFIKTVGMQDDGNGKMEAINLEFTYQDGAGGFRRLSLPMLLAVPFPFITIDTVDIGFKARIAASAKQASSESRSSDFGLNVNAKAGYQGKRFSASLDVTASYSSKKDSKATQESEYSVEYTMDIAVHASQAGMPPGMAQILNILQDGISNAPVAPRLSVVGLKALLDTGISSDGFSVLVLNAGGDDLVTTADWILSVVSSDPAALTVGTSPALNAQDGVTLTKPTITQASDVTLTITATNSTTSEVIETTRIVRVLP